MEDPSITKRLIDFGTDEHEYDEVQDLPEESTTNNQSLLYNTQSNDNNNIVNNNIIATTTPPAATATATNIPTASTTTAINNSNNNNLDLPPELPPPKQKNSALNSKATKTKSSSKASKSKIPRSPSLASTLSYNNFQPPPISGIPPQTPPLPLGYQNKGKSLNPPPASPLSNNNVSIFSNNSNSNIMAGGSGNSGGGGGGGGLSASNGNAQRNSANMSANSRRPQIQISTPIAAESLKNFQYLTLTVRKDENGYGMKVSGDNPVFVESVKPGGAAQIAGLVAGDMILKVNGTEVRSEKHPTVVSLIKASTIVELAVKRSQKLARPTSVGIVPSTPVLSGRDRTASITGPQPVDSIKRREMETYKIHTLQKMLEQEKLNLERLKNDTNNPSYKLSEANIKKLREQLRQVGAETQQNRNSAQQLFHLHQHHVQQLQQQGQQQTGKGTPKSSKSKNKFAAQSKIEEDIPPPLPQRNQPRQLQLEGGNNNNGNITTPNSSSHTFSPISDLDHTANVVAVVAGGSASPLRNSPQPAMTSGNNSPQNVTQNCNKSKRSKTKTKALSDPKMSTQMFLQMEGAAGSNLNQMGDGCELEEIPPPLPPRQPGMLEESQLAGHRGSIQNLNNNIRPPPNSIDTLMQYPLVSTCTPVHRDNMAAAFPLSQRPNIVQQLQQHQQQQQQQQQQQLHGVAAAGSSGGVGGGVVVTNTGVLGQTPHNLNHMSKHRRVVSSPDNMHTRHPERQIKTNSGSWELIEKDDEETPPGTPPPPYRHAHSASMSGNEDSMHEHGGAASTSGIFVESHHFTPLAGGISLAPISHSSRIQAAQTSVSQKEIISMEDEDASDQEGPFIDENGPFNSLQRLLETENVAFLAVFLNYVLSNSEPAPLLFYLITALYKEGTSKDMRKWVYEIHSTFLVPRAPLSWYRQDESLAREVDAVLQNEFDKVEILRKVFWKSRKKARDIICEQLREFQQKRTAGLGTIYGPTDAQLMEAKGDKQKEQHIFEETLMKKLQYLIDEYEKDLPAEDPKKLALCSALSTVIHRTFITRSHPNSIIDRVHHFVSREKSFKSRLMGKKGKMIVRGHPLVLRQYYEVTHCNHCQTIIWGVSPQGFHCTDCKLNIHRPCSKILEENCPGPLPQAKRKDKDLHNDNKISKLIMGKIRPRTSTDMSGDKRQRHEPEELLDPLDFPIERLNSTSIQRHPSDRRTDSANLSIRSNGNTSAHLNASDLQSSFHGADTSMSAMGGGAQGGSATTATCNENLTIGALSAVAQQNVGAVSPGGTGALNDINAQDANEGNLRRERLHQQHQQNKSAPVSVNRSESYKERLSHKRNRSQRKTSDPNLTSRPNDDQPDLGLSNSNFTASSNSSLSSGGGSESPSTSMEQMGGAGVATPTATATAIHHHHQHQHSHQDSFHGSIGGSSNASFLGGTAAGGQMARHWNFESDEEDDLNEADWSSNVSAEILASLTDAEKKRQEIINEIYQTERSHVRTLKLLKHLFLFPLQDSGLLSPDHLMLLFPPSLSSLCDIHGAFELKLKQRRIDHNYIVNSVGDLFAEMFDGKSGEELREYAAQFCARQQIALEALKEKRRKDEQLQKLLSKAESHKACRRLQLKDLLPTVLQRLTKYPLLFENLYKVTVRVVPEDTAEAEAIQRALESSKKILVDVNQAVKTAEDAHKLQNIQRKLDKSTFDKDEFKNLDLTQYRLIHDGSLTMKKNPSTQLHGLLFETMIVLLTKQDDKYSLKYLHANRNTDVNKPVSPIMSIDSETLVRQEAADKNSFFLIKTKTSQMLELRAPSSSECKTWFKHISDAAEQYKPRSKNANQEPVDDPAIATLPHSNTRESLELTPERPPPQSATATLITTPLAPMMPVPSVSQERSGFAHSNNNDVQLRNGRRESTPTSSSSAPGDAYPPYYNIKQRLSHNELSPNANAVNRTMSTRSCGDANHNYSNTSPEFAGANGVTLRHTQSARQSNGSSEDGNAAAGAGGVTNKRDSASIVYSNNSNNTRTLMQSSPPLVEPTAIQISISPAHTAEPVLTPAEKLRRLDVSIRDGLMEKQKIICDMFRLPVEHFHEIVDIAAMPEAPKDSTDIALAAYAQVQSLTEVINEYMKVTPEQEVSAVSTAVCDKCHEKRENQQHTRSRSNVQCGRTETKAATSSSDTPPPLPPPNKQMAQAQQQTPAPTVTKMQTCALEEANIHEDDDGYCEIDELRLPALPPLTKTPTATATPPPLPPAAKVSGAKQGSPPPPLPPPAGTFKTPPPPPPPPAKTLANQNQNTSTSSTANSNSNATPELVKRQSTISADSIPEESADEVSHALNDHIQDKIETKSPDIKEDDEENDETTTPGKDDGAAVAATKEETEKTQEEQKKSIEISESVEEKDTTKQESSAPIATIEDEDDKDEDSAMHTAECESAPLVDNVKDECKPNKEVENKDVKDDVVSPIATTSSMMAEPQRQNSNATQADEEISLNSEHIEINEAYECLSTLNKINTTLASMVDSSTQTLPLTTSLPVSTSTTIITSNSTNNNNNANNTTTTTSVSSSTNTNNGHLPTLCGPNRIQHANSLEPSVPCHALSSIVSVLNNQISLLLPKISERDMERERLRKENQHLRELLNAMHERQRVEAKLETPSDITIRADVADDEIDGFSPANSTTPTPTPTPTTSNVNTVAALGEEQYVITNNNSNTTSTATITTTTTSESSTTTETTNTVEAQN